jgi:hypothetical protein
MAKKKKRKKGKRKECLQVFVVAFAEELEEAEEFADESALGIGPLRLLQVGQQLVVDSGTTARKRKKINKF